MHMAARRVRGPRSPAAAPRPTSFCFSRVGTAALAGAWVLRAPTAMQLCSGQPETLLHLAGGGGGGGGGRSYNNVALAPGRRSALVFPGKKRGSRARRAATDAASNRKPAGELKAEEAAALFKPSQFVEK